MPSSYDLTLKNGKCFIDGQLKTTDIGISDGIIKSIGNIQASSDQKILDASNFVVLPGVIDTQVHFREPGSTDVEDLESGSKAAVLGGVTSDRKSTRLNSSHALISYAVFCLKKKKK